MGEADFHQFMRLRNQLVNTAENFAREENLTTVLIPKMSKEMDEQLKLAYIVLTTPKTSPEKLTLTVVQMQQLLDIEKIDSKEEISSLKWTVYNGTRKVCVNFQTDTDKLNIVVYRYRKNLTSKILKLF